MILALHISLACLKYVHSRIILAYQNGLLEEVELYELVREVLKSMPKINKPEDIYTLDKMTVVIEIEERHLIAILAVSNFGDVDENRNLVGAELMIKAKNALLSNREEGENSEIERLKKLWEGGDKNET